MILSTLLLKSENVSLRTANPPPDGSHMKAVMLYCIAKETEGDSKGGVEKNMQAPSQHTHTPTGSDVQRTCVSSLMVWITGYVNTDETRQRSDAQDGFLWDCKSADVYCSNMLSICKVSGFSLFLNTDCAKAGVHTHRSINTPSLPHADEEQTLGVITKKKKKAEDTLLELNLFRRRIIRYSTYFME